MPKFVFAYHGGKMPESAEEGQKIMAAWMKWFETMGSAVVDGGNPVGPSRTVTASGVAMNGGANPLSGYSLVNAASIDAATDLAKGCPILANGGTIEVAEAMDM
ncbi:MAG: hypothetical protein WBC90_19085 [Albidovulum sp.]|jgi:hypothetical protein